MAEFAFSLNNHNAVAAYTAAAEASRAAGLRAVADAEALGHNTGPAVSPGMWGMPDVITGLFVAQYDQAPDGWRYLLKCETLRPRVGRPGASARQWLADHPLPPDARVALFEYGLPYYGRRGLSDGVRYVMKRPQVFVAGDIIWARYDGAVDGDCMWMPQPLSAFHAALEAAQAKTEVNDRG